MVVLWDIRRSSWAGAIVTGTGHSKGEPDGGKHIDVISCVVVLAPLAGSVGEGVYPFAAGGARSHGRGGAPDEPGGVWWHGGGG
jgi:hypothetical protein